MAYDPGVILFWLMSGLDLPVTIAVGLIESEIPSFDGKAFNQDVTCVHS